jgi:transcriptional regulator with XRE-family HTH domain
MTNQHRTIIGGKIQRLRKSRGWSQADLGASIGRHQSRVAKWELGQGKPEPHDILRIAETFDVSLRFLCDDSETEPHQEESMGVSEMNDDEKFLFALAKKVGARKIVDHYLGIGEPVKDDSDGTPGLAKPIALRRVSSKTPSPTED